MPPWTIRPEDVEDYALALDNANSFSWKRAIAAKLACSRHPYNDRDKADCKLDKCVICHTYREEARPKNEVGGWVWSKNDVAEYLNDVLPHLCKEALKEPIWTAAMGNECCDSRKNMPAALNRLEAARGRNVKAWKALTHIAVNTWTLDEVQTKQRLHCNITVKLGRKNGSDTPENWYFMVGEDPGNHFYHELYKRVVRRTKDSPY